MSFAIGHRLPSFVSIPLFGDRERFGKVPDVSDPTWKEWRERDLDFYLANQRTSVGLAVNRAGYRIVSAVGLDGKRVLEIGPGAIEHIPNWRGKPAHWTNYDIRADLLAIAGERVAATGVAHTDVLAAPESDTLPFEDGSFDYVFSFYALEHIHPLERHLVEILRVLKPGGLLVGAIPCEGGLAWGTGRLLTSRRWLKKHTTIDPNRLICWEHPNFADFVLNELTRNFDVVRTSYWPLLVPAIDINLVASFVCRKRV